jgi:mono/diheme cytochrome c family protein
LHPQDVDTIASRSRGGFVKSFTLAFLMALAAGSALGAAAMRQGTAAPGKEYRSSGRLPTAQDDSAVAKGKQLYGSYMCGDCHGMNGEGSDSAPALTMTHLSADEIAAFLEKPSPDARGAGMPSVARDSPDSAPLVAFVVSLKKPQQ